MRLGVISDTHGKLPRGLAEAFAGVDRIVHAGDVESESDLVELAAIAPITAVAGNCDRHRPVGATLRDVERFSAGEVPVTVVHELASLRGARHEPGLVICGHTHRPEFVDHPERPRLNPGSASSRNGGRPPTVALATVAGRFVAVEFIEL